MSVKSKMDAVYALRLARLLGMDFQLWEAFKLGIIDEKGNVIKRPKTPIEKSNYTKFHSMVRSLKQTLQKYTGSIGTSALSAKMGWNALIKEYGIPDVNDMDLSLITESNELTKVVEMIAGDAGGDANNIASGVTSGDVTTMPSTLNKSKFGLGKRKTQKNIEINTK